MAKVVAFTLEAVGMPMVKGGSANSVLAFESIIRRHGGQLRTGADVQRVVIENSRAVGVRLQDGIEVRGGEVICNVTPTQLYGRLIDRDAVPPEVSTQAKRWRYGKQHADPSGLGRGAALAQLCAQRRRLPASERRHRRGLSRGERGGAGLATGGTHDLYRATDGT
jgi:hypothetical protein